MRPRAEALAEAERWELSEPFQARRGHAGERLGSGTGASLEFQDRRVYVAGDDVRHIDWRAFGRSDQLLVRQFREEVLPRVELLVDDSASMGVGEDKRALAVDLPVLMRRAARAAGASVTTFALGDTPRRLDPDELEQRGLALNGRRPLLEALGETRTLLAHGALRILISDLLSPLDPVLLARRLASGAGGVLVLQLLSTEDVAPPIGAALRLTDAETGGSRDLVVDEAAGKRYTKRLEALSDGVREGLRRHGGRFVQISGRGDVADVARNVLAPAGVLSPS